MAEEKTKTGGRETWVWFLASSVSSCKTHDFGQNVFSISELQFFHLFTSMGLVIHIKVQLECEWSTACYNSWKLI